MHTKIFFAGKIEIFAGVGNKVEMILHNIIQHKAVNESYEPTVLSL